MPQPGLRKTHHILKLHNFEETEFSYDVCRIPFHEAYVLDDIDEWLLTDIINEHVTI